MRDREKILFSQVKKFEITKHHGWIRYLSSDKLSGRVLCFSAFAQAKGLLCIASDADGLKENVIDFVKPDGSFPKRIPPELRKNTEVINIPEEIRNWNSNEYKKKVEKEFTIEEQKIKFTEFLRIEWALRT